MIYFSPQAAVIAIIFLSSVARLVLASVIGLGVDESYVAAIARQFSWSYFDHPPFHFWIIGFIAALTGSENPVLLRLPFICLFAGTTWLMYRITAGMFGEWAGVYAALLLNVSAVFSLSSGSWLLPDGPLLFFMLLAALYLCELLFVQGNSSSSSSWMFVGGLIGLGMLSKYHAIFIGAGTFLYILTTGSRRELLRKAGPYLGMLMAFVIFSPVLFWNYSHEWISFLFQSGRSGGSGFYPVKLLGNIAGQAAWILPWIWLPLVWGGLTGLVQGPSRGRLNTEQDKTWFLCCLAAGPVALFSLSVLLGGQGLFHWQAPGYLFLFPLLGKSIARKMAHNELFVRWWMKGSVTIFIILIVLLASHTSTGWLRTLAPGMFLGGDPTVEALNWQEMPDILAKAQSKGVSADIVVAGHWIDAGKIDYALSGKVPVLCLSDQPHHFAYLHRQSDFTGKNAIIIGRKDTIGDAVKRYGSYFDAIEPLGDAKIQRFGRDEISLILFYGRNFHGNYPLPYGR